MILGGINNYCATEDVKYQMDNSYTRLCTTSLDVDQVKEMVNLGNAEITSINYDGTKLTELVIESNNHTFTLCPSGQFAMDDEECSGEIALVGTPIIEKAKELVYSNDACKTDGTTYQYMGGCYIKGNPNNNYIWYSGFLWRIMGINADGTVRLITDENVTAIPWGAENTAENWDDSYAKDWLNNYFYPRLKGNDIIKEETWCSETTTDEYSARTTCSNNLSTETAKVGLLTLDEYNLAGDYLLLMQDQWTMTPYNNSYGWYVRDSGKSFSYDDISFYCFAIRPVINVYSNIIITSGNGTLGATWSNKIGPYILNENKNIETTGKLNEKATSGEYVLFAGKKYRVVDKDSNGNTKLILDGYYEEPSGTIYEMSYGSNNTFSTETGIGQKLNVDVLNWLTNNNESEKNKLVSDYTWYQNNFAYGQSYTMSLNEENPTRIIKATVGLIRIGEMLSTQSISILTNNHTMSNNYNNAKDYWTITAQNDDREWLIYYVGYSDSYGTKYEFCLRPVIVIKSDVEIIGGTGTFSNPYQI